MDSSESVFAIIMVVCLGLSLVAAIIGVFLFNGFDWWDKL